METAGKGSTANRTVVLVAALAWLPAGALRADAIRDCAREAIERLPDSGEVQLRRAAARAWLECLLSAPREAQLGAVPGEDGEKLLEKVLKRAQKALFELDLGAAAGDPHASMARVVKGLSNPKYLGVEAYRQALLESVSAALALGAETRERIEEKAAPFEGSPALVKPMRSLEDESEELSNVAVRVLLMGGVIETLVVKDAKSPEAKGAKKELGDLLKRVQGVATGMGKLEKKVCKVLGQTEEAGDCSLSGSKKIQLECPTFVPLDPIAGDEATFTVVASFPGEEWLGFDWDFDDGTPVVTHSPIYGSGPIEDSVGHVYARAGTYIATLTVYHGFKGGTYGVGDFKYARTVTFKVIVDPSED